MSDIRRIADSNRTSPQVPKRANRRRPLRELRGTGLSNKPNSVDAYRNEKDDGNASQNHPLTVVAEGSPKRHNGERTGGERHREHHKEPCAWSVQNAFHLQLSPSLFYSKKGPPTEAVSLEMILRGGEILPARQP